MTVAGRVTAGAAAAVTGTFMMAVVSSAALFAVGLALTFSGLLSAFFAGEAQR